MKIRHKLAATVTLAGCALTGTAQAATTPRQDEAAIRKLLLDGCEGFVAKDLDRAVSPYGKDIFSYDITPPEHKDYAALRKDNEELMAAMASTPTCTYRDMVVKSYGNVAYARYVLPYSVTLKSGAKIDLDGRGTDILEKSGGKWRIVHEHFSVPVNPITGQAQMKAPAR